MSFDVIGYNTTGMETVADPIISGPLILAVGILIGFGVHRIINEILYKYWKKENIKWLGFSSLDLSSVWLYCMPWHMDCGVFCTHINEYE